MTERELSFSQLGLAAEELFAEMGYAGDKQPDAQVRREAAEAFSAAEGRVRPRFSFFVTAKLPAFGLGTIISRQLQGSEAYAFFIATAGREYDEWVGRLKSEGDLVRVYMADALGTLIAERTADLMEESLQQTIDKLQWHRTNRFSPGYCGWHVSEQQRLFPLFGGHTCGVTLTESQLMVPIKSVSGVIGLGRSVRRLPYTCGLCQFEKCYKRAGKKPDVA